MSDDRVPVWNPLFVRLLVAASDYNCIMIQSDTKKIVAPWKQRRECVLVDTRDSKKWKFSRVTESYVHETYPKEMWLPKTKTARQKMEKDDLYLICTLFDIHLPKWTKKAMLEVL